jgi:RHS repeat-associated protein
VRTIGGTGTKVRTVDSYDNANRITTQVHAKVVTSGSPPTDTVTPLATFVYSYDSANRLTTQVDAEGTATFTYDNTDQLTAVGGSRTESFGYDANGNRNTTGYSVISGNRYSSGGGFTFAYDAEGNVTGKTEVATGNAWTYAFDQRNRMTGATEKNSGGSTIMQATYTYDALGRRIGTKVDDDGSGPHAAVQTWVVYDGRAFDANTYADFNGSGTLLTRYLYAPAVDALLARTSSGGTSAWYLPDKLGSIRDIADTSGAVIDHVVYNSFGTVTSETNSANGDRFKFTGREYDSTTGLYYFRARFYDPVIGRFTSLDPIRFAGSDASLYRYVKNGPTLWGDPAGKQPKAKPPLKDLPFDYFDYENPAEMSDKDYDHIMLQLDLINDALDELQGKATDAEFAAAIGDARALIDGLRIAAVYGMALDAYAYTLVPVVNGKLLERGRTFFTWKYFGRLNAQQQIECLFHESCHYLGEPDAPGQRTDDPKNPPMAYGIYWADQIFKNTKLGDQFKWEKMWHDGMFPKSSLAPPQ